MIYSHRHQTTRCLLRLYYCPSNVLLPFDFSTSTAGMMCRFHFNSSLLPVFCYLVASFRLTTAAGVRRSAASMPNHFHCARWTFKLTLEAIYSNATSPTTASTTTSSTPLCQPSCLVGYAGSVIEFDWVQVSFNTQVLVTVLVKINTVLDITVTTTKYGTATQVDGISSTGYITDITSFWNSAMQTTGVVVVSDIPTLTYKPTVYTAPGQYIVITTVLYATYAMTW